MRIDLIAAHSASKNKSAWGDDFPRLEDCTFTVYPPQEDRNGLPVSPWQVRVIRHWPDHRLDGEHLGDVSLSERGDWY